MFPRRRRSPLLGLLISVFIVRICLLHLISRDASRSSQSRFVAARKPEGRSADSQASRRYRVGLRFTLVLCSMRRSRFLSPARAAVATRSSPVCGRHTNPKWLHPTRSRYVGQNAADCTAVSSHFPRSLPVYLPIIQSRRYTPMHKPEHKRHA